MHLEYAVLYFIHKKIHQEHISHEILSEGSCCRNGVQITLTGFQQKFCILWLYMLKHTDFHKVK